MIPIGRVPAGSTIYIPISTALASGARGDPSSALEAADFVLYKNGSTVGRTSQAGWTSSTTFNSKTGLHMLAIDLSDNTDPSFYVVGGQYQLGLYPDETVDSLAVSAWVATFEIGPRVASESEISILAPYGAAFTLNYALNLANGNGLAVAAAHASGDTKWMKDEGAEANTTNGFTDEGQGQAQVITATEMQCARGTLYVVDQGDKVWADKVIHVYTYGHPSSQHPQLGVPIFDMAGAGTPTGANATTVTLPVGASSADNAYVAVLMIEAGLPSRILYGTYVGSTRVFTFDPAPGITYTTGAVVVPVCLPPSPVATIPAVNATQIGGSTSAAAIRAALGLASANLDTQLDALPTNAELATALGTADDAVLAAIAALNNLSQANIRTAVGLATANLDTQLDALPTNAELATALGTADDAVLAAIAALNNLSQANIRTAVGLASANTDTQLSAIAGYIDTEIAALTTAVGLIKAVTDALTSAAAAKLALSASGIISGTAATGTLSTTQATSSLTGYANDQLIGRLMTWLSGPASGEQTRIADYASASGLLTFTALTTAPANGNSFVIH